MNIIEMVWHIFMNENRIDQAVKWVDVSKHYLPTMRPYLHPLYKQAQDLTNQTNLIKTIHKL